MNGTPFRTTVAVYGGVYMIGFNKQLREQAGIAIGDNVEVQLDSDAEPRTAAVPPLLAAALEAADDAKAAFDALSYTDRREYADWIADAVRDDTRERRVKQAITMLREGEAAR